MRNILKRSKKLSERELASFWDTLLPYPNGTPVRIVKTNSAYLGYEGVVEHTTYSSMLQEWMYLIRFTSGVGTGYWRRKELVRLDGEKRS